MSAEALSIARRDGRPVDPWTLLTGRSVGIVAGFAVDLVRLGVHEARRAVATPRVRSGAARRWPCPACNAGSR